MNEVNSEKLCRAEKLVVQHVNINTCSLYELYTAVSLFYKSDVTILVDLTPEKPKFILM